MINELFSLKNKTAIVTGATGLLGEQHCNALWMAGANVVVCDLDETKCHELSLKYDSQVKGIKIDVTNPDSIKEVRDKTIDMYGGIDILVNNAAVNDMFEDPKIETEKSKFENYPLEIWNKSIDVNLTGVFLCSQIFGGEMAKKKNGNIINIASMYGVVAPDQSLYCKGDGAPVFFKPPAYSVSKSGVIALTRYLAAYWGCYGIRVNALSPGGVENSQDEFFKNNYAKKTPLKRMAQKTDYRGSIIFLASEASLYMTGANLIVDGGWTIW